MKDNFLKLATNPHQYDSQEIDWEKEGLGNTSSRRFFQEYLRQYLDVKDRTVLDVGSGMGQLFSLLKELGALKVEGVEPSVKNVKVSKRLYPDTSVFEGTLQQFSQKSYYDVVVSVMAFEHIYNLEEAFEKVSELLTFNGTFYLSVADKNYHLMPRFNYVLESEELGNDIIVSKTTRPGTIGTLYDILRPLNHYIKAAESNGLTLEKQIEMKPTEEFINIEPKYSTYKDQPICHLLIFKKQ